MATTTAGETVAAAGDDPCEIVCNLCGRQLADDPPETKWHGDYLTANGGMALLNHERCGEIWDALKGKRAELDALFASAGVDLVEFVRARKLLEHMLANGHI